MTDCGQLVMAVVVRALIMPVQHCAMLPCFLHARPASSCPAFRLGTQQQAVELHGPACAAD